MPFLGQHIPKTPSGVDRTHQALSLSLPITVNSSCPALAPPNLLTSAATESGHQLARADQRLSGSYPGRAPWGAEVVFGGGGA